MRALSILSLITFLLASFAPASSAQSWLLPCEAPAVHLLSDTLQIEGAFDGDPENSKLIIGDMTVRPVWETDKAASFLLKGVSAGPQEYELAEPGYGCAGMIRLLGIESSINKSRLKRGQKGKISLRVRGMEGLQKAVTLRIRNESPGYLSLPGGDVQEWEIHPGDKPSRTIPVRGVQPGPFVVTVELAAPAPETMGETAEKEQAGKVDAEEKKACGSVYGRVDNQLGRTLRRIVVFVAGSCDLCPPTPAMDTLKITNDCNHYEPSWAVVPAGAVITVENTAEIECDIAPRLATKFPDGTGFDEVFGPGETKHFEAKSYWENDNGLPKDYGLSDRFHQRIDMNFFVAPNQCYSLTDDAGYYSIGELPSGTYTLKIYTYPQRSYTPEATVKIEAGKRTRKDFVLEKNR